MRLIKKLFTHEDGKYYHSHKILGSFVLLNFIYRLYKMCINDHTLGFDMNNTSYLCVIILHGLLHVSSFEFILPRKRNLVYNIIWPEMRLHSAIFAYRSLLLMLLFYYEKYFIFGYMRYLLVVCTMALADVVTFVYIDDSNGSTTMRGNAYPMDTPKLLIKSLNYFYSISQVFATLHILFSPSADYAFLVLLPIQLAPFAMTLERKGYINQYMWHVIYILAILPNYIYSGINLYQPDLMWSYMIFFSVLRFKYKVDKYILWSIIYIHFCWLKIHSSAMLYIH